MQCRENSTPELGTPLFGDRRRNLVAAAIGFLILVAYGPTLVEMANVWIERPEYGHGLLMPPVAAWMIWDRRRQLAAIRRRDTAGGAWFSLLSAFAFLPLAGLLLLGEMKYSEAFKPYAFVATLAAGVGVVYGWRGVRALAQPLIVLLLMCPLPYRWHTDLTLPLKRHAAVLATGLLQISGIDTGLDGNLIHLPGTGSMFVADACSGVRSLISLVSVAILAFMIWRRHWALKLVVLASCVPLAIVVNGGRIWSTGMLSLYVSPAFAEGFTHLFEGYLLFLLSAALLLGWAWLLGRIFPARAASAAPEIAPEPPPVATRPGGVWMRRFAVATVLAISTTAIGGVYQIRSRLGDAERDGALAARLESQLATIPAQLEGYHGDEIVWDETIIENSGADVYRAVSFRGDGQRFQIFVGAATRNDRNFHAPNVCMPSSNWEPLEMAAVPFEAFPTGQEAPHMQRLLLQRGGEQLLVYYWFQSGERVVRDEWAVRTLRLLDFAGRRELAPTMIVCLYVPVIRSIAETEAATSRFLTAIGPHLKHAAVPGDSHVR